MSSSSEHLQVLSLRDLEWPGRNRMPPHVMRAVEAGSRPRAPPVLSDRKVKAWWDSIHERDTAKERHTTTVPTAKRAKLTGGHHQHEN